MGPPRMAPSRKPGEPPGLLDTGEEIIAIVTPVSICMVIVTGLVLTLRVGDNANAMQMQGGIAPAAYQEEVRPFNDTARRPPFA